MALNKNDLVQLVKVAMTANASAPTAYSFNGAALDYSAVQATAREELNALCATPALYRENQNLIFSVIEQAIDDLLPAKVASRYAELAEVRVFKQGERVEFKRNRTNNRRAKQFITRVGLAGRYEVFKLGRNEETFQIKTSALGGAAQIGFEEFLDGRIDMAEVLNYVLEGIDETIQEEIVRAMETGVNQLPSANRVEINGWDEPEMDRLVSIAAAYGTPVIYCTREFAVRMIPSGTSANLLTDSMREVIWNNGWLGNYKGTKVIILQQSFTDETNSKKVVNPGHAWVIATGANGKPVYVAMEGNTLMKEHENDDWSRDIQVYKKVGVAAMLNNSVCHYFDKDLDAAFNA
jgi:hypothetical protein